MGSFKIGKAVMSLYEWDENLATGIGDIDVQHQMVVDKALTGFLKMKINPEFKL